MEFPNLLLVGGPKCGTTSLFDWLAAHPEVCGSSLKETYYFMDSDNPMLRLRQDNLTDNYHDHGLSRYNQFFQNCSPAANIKLEATPHYMYQETTPTIFAQSQPQPFVVFILRQPSKRIFSHFNFSQNNLLRIDKNVSFQQFTDALLNENFETLKNRIYDEQAYFWLKNQLRYSRYYEHLKCWSDQFQADKMIVLLFEEMIANPKATVQNLCRTVDIDPSFYNDFDFKASNQTVIVNYKFIRRFLHTNKKYIEQRLPAAPLKQLVSSLKSVYSAYSHLQTKHIEKPKITPDTLARLDAYFSPHNQKLSREFNLNLDCWNT